MEEIFDASKLEDETISIKDGMAEIAKIFGGVALAVAENKRLLESKNPTTAQSALKSAGVIGASLVGLGSSIAKFVARNVDVAERK